MKAKEKELSLAIRSNLKRKSGICCKHKSAICIKDTTTGITLVALVVTIVVLLILAGITIMYVMGDNSIFNQASKSKLYTELAKIEEKASLIYSDKLLERVSTDLNSKPTIQEVVEELKNQGDKIEEIAIDSDGITGISLNRETMTLGFGGTNKVKITLERSDTSTKYYAVVDGKYYEMHFNGGAITIGRKPSEVSSEGTKQTLKITNSDDTVATATLEQSTNTITVIATNKAGTTKVTVTYGSYTKECVVTVKDIPITTAMELNSIRARIASGYTRWLTAMTTPTDALQEFEWSSSDTNIATVDNKGVITAKKAGTVTITAKTIDGSNKEGSCEVTVVENAVDVATLTEIQTGEKNIVAKDSNGNLITVPIGFKVLTSEGTKVTDGIVIQDRDLNEFVWVPVDSVSTGTSKVADDIRLGRYEDFITKNVAGNYIPKQAAYTAEKENNYTEIITIGNYYQELTSNSENTVAQNLGDFIEKTKVNGGYYFARYEMSKKGSDIVMSQGNRTEWAYVWPNETFGLATDMYKGNEYITSDLVNSYAWDTTIVFIQKFSEFDNYTELTGKGMFTRGDEVLHICDMASRNQEMTTEHSIYSGAPYTIRGGYSNTDDGYVSTRGCDTKYNRSFSLRVLVYLKN